MDKGYSYIELLLFFLIISIGFNYLNFRSLFLPSLQQSSKELCSIMQQTALQATTSRLNKQLIYQEQTKYFYLITELKNSFSSKKIFELPKSINIKGFNFGNLKNKNFEINFYPSGSRSPGSIVLSKDKQSCTIKQSLRGLVTLICN